MNDKIIFNNEYVELVESLKCALIAHVNITLCFKRETIKNDTFFFEEAKLTHLN